MRPWLGLVAAIAVATPALGESCADNRLDIRGPFGTARFSVEIADDAQERAQGLMNRESLPRFGGMLFVYPEAGPVAFWMRNTLIPLDMLFFDEAGRLARVHENAKPLDETPIIGGDAIRYVLEINGGMTKTLGIDEGAELQSPAIDQATAAWPCG